ncbi:MAG TPA: DUF2059 domain-containing protein [Myxococcaceae bacterium]|jgi:hypothetical protein
MLSVLVVAAVLAADPPRPDASHRALAMELVQLVTPEPSYRSGVQQMTAQMVPSLEAQARATGTTLPPDFRQRFEAVLLEVVPYEEQSSWAADVYARNFTASELKELIAFYRTTLGQKLATRLPTIMGEVGKRVSDIIPQRMPAALKKHGLLPQGQGEQPATSPQPAKQSSPPTKQL